MEQALHEEANSAATYFSFVGNTDVWDSAAAAASQARQLDHDEESHAPPRRQQQQQPLSLPLPLPDWLYALHSARERIFLNSVEPWIVAALGPVHENGEDKVDRGGPNSYRRVHFYDSSSVYSSSSGRTPSFDDEDDLVARRRRNSSSRERWWKEHHSTDSVLLSPHNPFQPAPLIDHDHRRLLSWPAWQEFLNSTAGGHNYGAEQATNFSFATLLMLFLTLNCVFLIFLSCFYHNQKTSPLFISPRRHRLPKLVPPPLPVDGYFSWVKVCLYLSDEEIINRIGYDSLIFIRFHRLALRCIVKMSIFSFVVLLPLNFTGNISRSQDIREMMFFTNFMLFSMANIENASPRFWVHCFAAYLLTGIVVRELLIEYETFNSIRHRYLLSREPHLRTVLVTNIPRHLRSARKITSYFRHVYPNAVKSVFMCQNLIRLEALIRERTLVLSRIEKELLVLCRTEKKKLYEQGHCARCWSALKRKMEDEAFCSCFEGPQERLSRLYTQLDDLNNSVEAEQSRRQKVMRMLDHMEAGAGAADIDYVLASPFIDGEDAKQRRVLGLATATSAGSTAAANTGTAPATSHLPLTQSMKSSRGEPGPYQAPRRDRKGPSLSQQRPAAIPEEAGNEVLESNGAGGDLVALPAPPVASSSSSSFSTIEDNGSGLAASQLRSRSPAVEPAQKTAGLSSSVDAENPKRSGPTLSSNARYPTASLEGSGGERSSSSEDDENEDVVKENALHPRGVRRGLRSFAKAKQAIRRYGRFSRRSVSFLGRPIHHRSQAAPPPVQGHIEDHINEVTDKAFVVMRTFTAATIAIQSMHSSKPGSMQVSTAPEPRDILWKNIYVSKGAHRTRSFLGEALVLIIILFYVFPVAVISVFTSDDFLKKISPRLTQLAEASSFFSAAIALVQPLCIVGMQQLLPPLFMFIGEAEGILSFSEVQMRAFSRYFLFQVINVFLVPILTSSIFDTIANIIEKPESAFIVLGSSLPRLSSFFITFITIKTFLALGFELVRTMSLVQAMLRYFLIPNATLRTQRTVVAGMRAVDDPGWFPFHKILAQDMLVVVVSVVFAVVAPLVLLPCAIFCLYSRIMWTHHHLFVYESVFESGGQFWPKIFRRFVFGLIIAQMTITGQFIVKQARHEAYATIVLMFLTYFFLRSTRARYDATSSSLPLEVATVMDISLHQEEVEAHRRWEQQQEQYETKDNSGVDPVKTPPDQGAMVSRFDPFRKAYLQPALRANPKARPEQPFPPAQLGRETVMSRGGGGFINSSVATGSGDRTVANAEVLPPPHGFRSDDSADDDGQDSGATVRLKSLNQQDRRLINRWWNDQLQRAGDQNLFAILIGEECGTLTLSPHPTNQVGSADAAAVDLHDQTSFSPSFQSMV